MSNQVKNKGGKTSNSAKKPTTKSVDVSQNERNAVIMKILVVLGVIVLFISIVYLMNYFFVEKSYIKINMSTDKKLEYITIRGDQEIITTQKYVSDLDYTMRYDINNFKVFKYKSQDIFKCIDAEKILVVVEKSKLPDTCNNSVLNDYSNCIIAVDNYTEEHYVTKKNQTYKLTIKKPNSDDFEEDIKSRIDYMINSFETV